MPICIAPPTSATFFPASRPTTCRRCRRSPTRCARTGIDPATIVVGPDAESRPWVSDLAGRLGLAHTVAQQDSPRRPLGRNQLCRAAPIAGRPVLLVDDIVSSGGTLIACAKALTAAGATAIDAVITHALFPPDMAARFCRGRHSFDPLDRPACRIRPMRSRSTMSSPRPCAAKWTAQPSRRRQHERDRSILRRGPHGDGLVLPVRNAVRALPGRLRPVPGAKRR